MTSAVRRAPATLITAVSCCVGWLWLSGLPAPLTPGDEAIYVLGGKLLSEGHLPYRDFFLAHPPLRVLLSAGLFALGAPAAASKWCVALATALNLLLIVALARRCCEEPSARDRAGALAALLWFGATLPLEVGGHYLGINLAVTFQLAALLCAARGRWAWSGLCLGFGAHQALYVLLMAPSLTLWAWRSRRLRNWALGLMAWPVGAALAWMVWGDAYLQQTLLYHFKKVQTADRPWPVHRIVGFVVSDWLPVLAASVSAAAAWRRSEGVRGNLPWLWLCAAQGFAVVCLYRSVQAYYFMLPLSVMCAVGAGGISALLRTTEGSRRRLWLGVCAALWLVTAVPHLHGAHWRRTLQPVVAAEVEQLAQLTQKHPTASGLLWGDSSIAPLMALKTGSALAANQIDTNDKRFRAGLIDVNGLISDVLQRHKPALLMIARHGVFRVGEVRAFIERNYRADFVYPGRAMGYEVYFLRHRDEPRRGRRPAGP